jgi:hypothetical protein
MAQQPTLLILGTYHMANPGRDLIHLEADDVLAPKRQREIEALVNSLKAFRPTKIAVEVDPQHQDELNERYRAYCEGRFTSPLPASARAIATLGPSGCNAGTVETSRSS